MRWRARILVIGGAAVAAGAAVGILTATGALGGSSEAGTQASLRLQPKTQTVACGEDVTTRLYLDELAFRPDTEDSDQPFGIGLFEFQLGYDPSIVRLTDASSLTINSALSGADADGDGLSRQFTLTSSIDDTAGTLLIAGVSSVDGTGPVQGEQGPALRDGEPLLLLTIRVAAVGQGETTLSLRGVSDDHPSEPLIGDPLGEPYAPVAVTSATIIVSAGACPRLPPSPTPAPATPVPTAIPTSTTQHPVTPIPVGATPSGSGGRGDCPEDWYVYADPEEHFSLCYEKSWRTATTPPEGDAGTVITFAKDTDLLITLYQKDSTAFARGLRKRLCDAVDWWESVREVTVSIAGTNVKACTGFEPTHAPEVGPVIATYAEIPLEQGRGYLILFVLEREGASQSVKTAVSAALDLLKPAN
jgi:hypothetical protein